MQKLSSRMMLAVLMLASVLVTTPVAMAEETSCRGTIGARTVDNLRVPSGESCTLDGTSVKGTITVERGATLRAQRVKVTGNIQAENHKYVTVTGGSTVGGSIQIDQGGAFKVVNVQTKGSIQVVSNQGSSLLKQNRVNADIQVFSHRDGVRIVSNRIDGNLQCKENSPAPTGSGNIVQGNKEDQCKRL
jgi:hypothetical protein